MEKLAEILGPVVPYLLAAISVFIAKYAAEAVGSVSAKAIEGLQHLKRLGNENKYLAMVEFDDWLNDKLQLAIIGTQDSYVAAVKKASADGKLTELEVKEATKLAFEQFKGSLTAIELAEIMSVLGADLEKVVRARLPGIVGFLKQEKPAEEEIVAVLKDVVKDPQ